MADLRDDTVVIGQSPVEHMLWRGMADVEWIPVVAARGWVAITVDHRLRTRPYEPRLALEYGLKCVNLRSVGNLGRWSQLVRVARHWDSVEEFALARPHGPWWLSLTKTGQREYEYRLA